MIELVGWEDRDWAKWTNEERKRFVGGGRGSSMGGRSPRHRRQRSGKGWNRELSPLDIFLVFLVLFGLVVLSATTGFDLRTSVDRLARGQPSSPIGTHALEPGDGQSPLSSEDLVCTERTLDPTTGVERCTAYTVGRAPTRPPDTLHTEFGGPWPGGTIAYFNGAPEHAWAVRQAVRAWNRSGVRVRFVATSANDADVVIASTHKQKCGHGRATVGYAPRSTVLVFRPSDGEGCDRYSAARVLAHELGHVLGLRHNNTTCAAMNSAGNLGGSRQCPANAPWEWRCRLLEPPDLLAAAKLYGGSPRAPRRAMCALYQPVRAPDRIRLVADRSDARQLAISFVRPPAVVTPSFLGGGGEPSFAFSFGLGDCAGRSHAARYRWSVGPGKEQMIFPRILGKGVHCLRVWAFDQLGRASDTASMLKINVR